MSKSVIAALVFVLAASFGAYKVESSLDKPKTSQSTSTVDQPEKLETTSPKEESKVMQEDKQSAKVENTASAKVQTTTEAQNEPVVEAFDAQLYAMGVLEEKAAKGMGGNEQCFTKLIAESTGWNLTKVQIDAAIEKAFTKYSSTCAAYAQFKETGEW